MSEILNIVIITEASFPNGFGATNRIIAYSKGLLNLGHKVRVICYRPTEDKKYKMNDQKMGKIDGIMFEYSSNTIIRYNNKLLRVISTVTGIIKIFPTIVKYNRNEKIDALIFVSNSALAAISLYAFTRFYNIKYILEKSEFPFVLQHKSMVGKLYGKFYINNIYKLFDGIFCMTKTLYDYFKKLKYEIKLCHIPMTVEIERFSKIETKPIINNEYFAYCGDMRGNKDGLLDLIEAFAVVHQKFPKIYLVLIGNTPDNKEHEKIISLIKNYNLKDVIIFTGKIKSNEVPNYLIYAKGLLLARPNNMQAQGGFPTKLGEYLATGNPVVVTSVGEIPVYLKDMETAYISESDNPSKFANKMLDLLNNTSKAMQIGKNGQQVAKNFFSSVKQSIILEKFIKEIITFN